MRPQRTVNTGRHKHGSNPGSAVESNDGSNRLRRERLLRFSSGGGMPFDSGDAGAHCGDAARAGADPCGRSPQHAGWIRFLRIQGQAASRSEGAVQRRRYWTCRAPRSEARQDSGMRLGAFLGEQVEYPERMEPRVKSRFEMLIAPKEHEMHHRGQLMVVERMLGITPHLRRQMEERIASMRPAQTGPIDTGNCAVDTIAANRILD